MANPDLEIRKAKSFFDHARCVQIRTLVFVVGQNVPTAREIDEFEDTSFHHLALISGVPVGTARWRWYGVNGAKIERLAVLPDYRGQNIGAALIRYVLRDILERREIVRVTLSSQDHAIPFYEAFGFHVVGDMYEDAGMPHFDMILDVPVRAH